MKKPQVFAKKVLEVVKNIPKGSTLTYGDVAWLAGSPGAFRAVGSIMSKNFDKSIPCHRVVRSDGKPGQWNRGREKKEQMLKREGAINSKGKANGPRYARKHK